MIELDETDWLAAQYAIGSLAPGERRLVESRMRRDKKLAEAVDAWHRRLSPRSLREPGLAPPPRILDGILATLVRRSMARSHGPDDETAWRARPRRWIGQAAIAATLVGVAVAFGPLVIARLDPPTAPVSAVLSSLTNTAADEPGRPTGLTFTLLYDGGRQQLTVRRTAGELPRGDRSLMLWLFPSTGNDALLIGRLDPFEQTVLPVGPAARTAIGSGRLVVTVEADAGITRPRGPAVAAGRIERTP